jgi:hypothetical protein
MRAERPVRKTWVGAKSSSGGQRDPSSPASTHFERPTITSSGPGSNRPTTATSNVAGSRPKTRATSALTAAKISAGAVSCATSVATRRSAACSSASRASASRPSVFAITAASSSVNSARRAPVLSGSRSVLDATTAPHTRPAIMIGTPTLDRMPLRRRASAMSPSSSS